MLWSDDHRRPLLVLVTSGMALLIVSALATPSRADGLNENNPGGVQSYGSPVLDLRGVGPGDHWTRTLVLDGDLAPRPGSQALDMTGRSGQVVIEISGTGLMIEYVYSRTDTVPSGVEKCTQATLELNDEAFQGPTQLTCKPGDQNTYFWTSWNFNDWFNHGDVFCVTWADFIGRPCGTVLQ